jgi:hypothetical protein
MVKSLTVCLMSMVSCLVLQAANVDTNDPSIVSAFQSGAIVISFESVTGVTPQAITSYHAGDPASSTAFLFGQVPSGSFAMKAAIA